MSGTTKRILVAFCLAAPAVNAHGAMQFPPTWFDPQQGRCGLGPNCFGAGVMWFTNDTNIPGEPTIPDDSGLRTYHGASGSYPGSAGSMRTNPWRAPGSAPIASPCGISGGNPLGCPKGDAGSRGKPCPGGGSGWGPDALNTSHLATPWSTEWRAGSVVEAAWGIRANHGGGYSYRMCRRDPSQPFDGLSEACFQATPLEFSGDTSWVHFDNATERVAFRANGTAEGTTPVGSQWRKNPIPACKGPAGGSLLGVCLSGTQFPSPASNPKTGKKLQGFCESAATGYQEGTCPFAIVDRLKVPPNLAPGDWVLSFRWDCEQTPQVWNTCSNIKVVA